MSLSRIKLILKVYGKSQLSYNYQFNLMKTIYSAATKENKNKALELHNKGFVSLDNKKFKLFNYSLFIENAKYNKDNIVFDENSKIILTLSGYEEVLNLILKGFIKLQQFILEEVNFKIDSIEDDKKVRFNNVMLYKVRTPIVESIYNKDQNKIIYLNPMKEEFYKALHQNLLRKYELIYGEEYSKELYFDIENVLKVSKKYITNIKENGYIIGYSDFEIWIEASPKMQKVAYYCGLGQNNSIGMGLLTYITGRRCVE